jgi:hypothetical protein
MKFDVVDFHENPSRNYKFSYNWAKISGTLYEDLIKFTVASNINHHKRALFK